MADHFDFLQLLETDVALKILTCLDDSADLIRASSVSRFWRDSLIANGLCKQLCLRIFPQLANVAFVAELNGKNKKSVDVESSNSMQWEALDREHKVYASLFKALTAIKVINCLAHAVSASSTDNYPEESIRNTLDPRDQILRRGSYWSSKGQSNPEVPETLIYKLRAGFYVITEINIQPFQAYFQPGHPIYSSKSVRFRIGQPKFPADIDKDLRQLPLQQHADEKFIWTYSSQDFPMSQENHLQNFKLPEPILCIGGFLQIELLGRVQTQATDDLFYICVSHVQVLGRPLTPAFDVDILGPSGKFSLKYDREALPHTLQNDSLPTPSSVASLPEHRIWGHLGGFLQFIMPINEQGAELIELEDDEDNELDHMLME